MVVVGGVVVVGGAGAIGVVVTMPVGLVGESPPQAVVHAALAAVSNPSASLRLHCFFVLPDMVSCSKRDIQR